MSSARKVLTVKALKEMTKDLPDDAVVVMADPRAHGTNLVLMTGYVSDALWDDRARLTDPSALHEDWFRIGASGHRKVLKTIVVSQF